MNIRVIPRPNPDPFEGLRKEINGVQFLTGDMILTDKDAKAIWAAYSLSKGNSWLTWDGTTTLADLYPFYSIESFADPL